MKNNVKYIIFILTIIIIIIIFIFKPFKLEKILISKIDYSNITSIKIKEHINAYVSNDYTIDNSDQIIKIYNELSKLRIRKCIFVPKAYSIQLNKTYRITIYCTNKILDISINTDGQNQYITLNNKTYRIILSK